jgi:hypothetical protein
MVHNQLGVPQQTPYAHIHILMEGNWEVKWMFFSSEISWKKNMHIII